MVSFTLIVSKHIKRIENGKRIQASIFCLEDLGKNCTSVTNCLYWPASRPSVEPSVTLSSELSEKVDSPCHHSSSDSVLVTQHLIKPILGPRLSLVFHRISLWLSAVCCHAVISKLPRVKECSCCCTLKSSLMSDPRAHYPRAASGPMLSEGGHHKQNHLITLWHLHNRPQSFHPDCGSSSPTLGQTCIKVKWTPLLGSFPIFPQV